MSFWLVSVGINFKRLIRDRAFWIVTLLLWAGLFAGCRMLSGGASVAVVRAGVWYAPEDRLAVQVYEALPQHSMVEFVPFLPGEIDEMKRQVRTGELECAYVLAYPFGDTIREKGLDSGAVTRVVSPSTMADAVLDELLFAAMLEACLPDMTMELIGQIFPVADSHEVAAFVQEKVAWYGTEEAHQFMEQQPNFMETMAVEGQDPVSLARRPLHGAVALMLLALTLFVLPRFINEKTPGLWRSLGFWGVLRYYDSVLFSLWLLNLAAGLPALLIIGLAFPAGLGHPGWEVLMLAVYAVALCAAGVCAVILLRTPDFLYAASIFVLLLALLLGGVLFDWTEISVYGAAISGWTVTENYIVGVVGGSLWGAVWLLYFAVGALVVAFLRLLLYRKTGKT